MATSYLGAKRIATKHGYQIVYHDFTDKTYGACPRGQPQGDFKGGSFREHACIYQDASASAADMEEFEERKFVEEPDWQERQRAILKRLGR